MPFTKEEAIDRARQDLAQRVGIGVDEIKEDSVADAEFPDMALGAAGNGEMSGQMITSGWRIRLSANGESAEYRANTNQIRLFNYRGENHKV
jgi:hypothetical protein